MLGVVLGLPALRQLMRIRRDRKSSVVVAGTVSSSRSAAGWLRTADYGSQKRALITCQTPKGVDMGVEAAHLGRVPIRKYEARQSVEVMFDSSDPGQAFVVDKLNGALREIWLGSAALVGALICFPIGGADVQL